jgi:hypothetical protein
MARVNQLAAQFDYRGAGAEHEATGQGAIVAPELGPDWLVRNTILGIHSPNSFQNLLSK